MIKEPEWIIGDAASAIEEYKEDLMKIVHEQAEDFGLWFQAQTAPEAYLQQALRRLHEAIEEKSSFECAMDALENLKCT